MLTSANISIKLFNRKEEYMKKKEFKSSSKKLLNMMINSEV